MKDYAGHRVFNPMYLFYLEWGLRDKWQKPDEVITALELPPSAVVADIGAGGGYFTEKFSAAVGPSGRVYATDVQEVMIKRLGKRVGRRGLGNVSVVRGGFHDTMLPESCCDLAFFSSVYKEIDARISYMRNVRRILKPGGRVAILEYRRDVDAPGPEPGSRLAQEQVIDEMQSAGFVLLKSLDFLPREYFLVFGAAP